MWRLEHAYIADEWRRLGESGTRRRDDYHRCERELSPATVTINSGESVRFVNSHNRTHQMASDPHPNHTDCPAINALPTLDPGQSGQTNALTTSRTCGVHDHLNDTDAKLKGSIVVR